MNRCHRLLSLLNLKSEATVAVPASTLLADGESRFTVREQRTLSTGELDEESAAMPEFESVEIPVRSQKVTAHRDEPLQMQADDEPNSVHEIDWLLAYGIIGVCTIVALVLLPQRYDVSPALHLFRHALKLVRCVDDQHRLVAIFHSSDFRRTRLRVKSKSGRFARMDCIMIANSGSIDRFSRQLLNEVQAKVRPRRGLSTGLGQIPGSTTTADSWKSRARSGSKANSKGSASVPTIPTSRSVDRSH